MRAACTFPVPSLFAVSASESHTRVSAAAAVTASEALGVVATATVVVLEAVSASTCAIDDALSGFAAHTSMSARCRLVLVLSAMTRGSRCGGDAGKIDTF